MLRFTCKTRREIVPGISCAMAKLAEIRYGSGGAWCLFWSDDTSHELAWHFRHTGDSSLLESRTTPVAKTCCRKTGKGSKSRE